MTDIIRFSVFNDERYYSFWKGAKSICKCVKTKSLWRWVLSRSVYYSPFTIQAQLFSLIHTHRALKSKLWDTINTGLFADRSHYNTFSIVFLRKQISIKYTIMSFSPFLFLFNMTR